MSSLPNPPDWSGFPSTHKSHTTFSIPPSSKTPQPLESSSGNSAVQSRTWVLEPLVGQLYGCGWKSAKPLWLSITSSRYLQPSFAVTSQYPLLTSPSSHRLLGIRLVRNWEVSQHTSGSAVWSTHDCLYGVIQTQSKERSIHGILHHVKLGSLLNVNL